MTMVAESYLSSLARRLSNYDACHDGDIDEAANFLLELNKLVCPVVDKEVDAAIAARVRELSQLSAQGLRLLCGELTTNEIRTVRAVLAYALRARPEEPGDGADT